MGHTGGVNAPLDPLLDRPAWVPAWVPSVDDVHAMRIFRWVLTAVFVAGLTACVVENADSPADPALGGDPTVSAPSSLPSQLASRFGTVLVDLIGATGEMVELCLLHADSAEERNQGLRGVTDLEAHDGMLFSWDQRAESQFVMTDTVMPLSISWWAADGTFVSGTDMTPCTGADAAACDGYAAAGPYRWAIEAPQGALPDASDGARIAVRAGETCAPG